jgi:hypothetical protein
MSELLNWWCGDTSRSMWEDGSFSSCFRFTFFVAACPMHLVILVHALCGVVLFPPRTAVHRLRGFLRAWALLCTLFAIPISAPADREGGQSPEIARLAAAALHVLAWAAVALTLGADFSTRTRRVLIALLGLLLGCVALGVAAQSMPLDLRAGAGVAYAGVVAGLVGALVYEETALEARERRRRRGGEHAPLLSSPINDGVAEDGATVESGPESSWEARATMISRLVFGWVWPLLEKAYNTHSVTMDDLPKVSLVTHTHIYIYIYTYTHTHTHTHAE